MLPNNSNHDEWRTLKCRFSKVKELTPALNPFQRGPPEKDMTCYFKQNKVKVVTRGGLEFVNNTKLMIEDVFALEDGLVFKCLFNSDLYYFEPGQQRSHAPKSFVYLSLLHHPLNDLHPISFDTQRARIQQTQEIVALSAELPFAVVFDSQDAQPLRFCLIKQGPIQVSEPEDDSMNDASPWTSAFSPALAVAGTTQLSFQTVFTTHLKKPSEVFFCQGLASTQEFVVTLFFGASSKLEVFACHLSDMSFKQVQTFHNVHSAALTTFSRTSAAKVKLLKHLDIAGPAKLFKKRLALMKQDLCVLEHSESRLTLHFLAGGYNVVHKLEVNQLFKEVNASDCQLISMQNSPLSSLGLTVVDKHGRPLSLQVQVRCASEDYLVNSVSKVLQHILPPEMFVLFFQEAVHAFASKAGFQDEFSKFANLLLSIIKGKQTDLVNPVPPHCSVVVAEKTVKTISGSRIRPANSGSTEGRLKKRTTISGITTGIMPISSAPQTLQSRIQSNKVQLKRAGQQSTTPIASFTASSAFEQMLATEFHSEFALELGLPTAFLPKAPAKSASKDLGKKASNPSDFGISPTDIEPYLEAIFAALHLLHEDLKLDKFKERTECPKLCKLLIALILTMNEPGTKAAYIAYYLSLHPSLKDQFSADLEELLSTQAGDIESVPQVYRTIDLLIQKYGHQRDTVESQVFPVKFEQTRKVLRIFEVLAQTRMTQPDVQSFGFYEIFKNLLFAEEPKLKPATDTLLEDKNYHLFEKVLFALLEEDFSSQSLSNLPLLVSLPLLEIIRFARLFSSEIQTVPEWPREIYSLIDRQDILRNLRNYEHSSTAYLGRQQSKLFALNTQPKVVETPDQISNAMQELIGKETEVTAKNEQTSQIQEFLKNRFSKDTRYKEAEHLLNSAVDMVIKHTDISGDHANTEEEQIRNQKLVLEKMFKRHLSKCVGRGALTLGIQEIIPTETLNIPKISQTGHMPALDAETPATSQTLDIGREERDFTAWPYFHNGVAAALRLSQSSFNNNSQVRNWIMHHKPQEPKNEHGGFLLGIGLLQQLKHLQPTDLYQHLKSAHDSTIIGILLGRACSMVGSMDEQDTKNVCTHIPTLLPSDLSFEISLPVQSAAVIGAGLLYQGTGHRLITEMLLAQISRKPTSDKMQTDREGFALSAGLALGIANLGQVNKLDGLEQRLIRFVEGGKSMLAPRSMQTTTNENNKSAAVKENDMVNTYITAPGALLALALIFLKSENTNITSQLSMPDSFFALEQVRPSLLLLKALTKGLIMWQSVEATEEWVANQVPNLVANIFTNDLATVEKLYASRILTEEIDFATVALSYVNIRTGALFAVGFKYAGTGNEQAKRLLLAQIEQLRKKTKVCPGVHPCGGPMQTNISDTDKNQVDKTTMETCLCVLSFALSLVMAGSCDSDCFRTFRVLRKRFEAEMHYGYNLAINMAMGFLFLGSGALTFSNTNEAIAALLCALYPVFPANPADNRQHLQALRHFYVLAVETRLLQAKDVDSEKFINIPVELQVRNELGEVETVTKNTPDIINGQILELRIPDNDEFHSVHLRPTSNSRNWNFTALQHVIFVKRKHQMKAVCDSSAATTEDLEKASDPSVQAFFKSFCNEPQNFKPLLRDVLLFKSKENGVPFKSVDFFDLEDHLDQGVFSTSSHVALKQTLANCVAQDKVQSLPVNLNLTSPSFQPEFLLHSYFCFMRASQARGFIKPNLFKQSVDEVQASQTTSCESIRAFIASRGETASRNGQVFAMLDPCLLQTLTIVTGGVLAQLQHMGEGEKVLQYLNQQSLDQTTKEIHESLKILLSLALKDCVCPSQFEAALQELGVDEQDFLDTALVPGIVALLKH